MKTLRDAYATAVGACAGAYLQHLLARACDEIGFALFRAFLLARCMPELAGTWKFLASYM